MATTRQKALDVAGKMLPPDLMQLLVPQKRAPFGAELSDLGMTMIFEPLWTREDIDLRTRSLITVAMLIALRAHSELAIHAPAAIRNGVTVAELEAAINEWINCRNAELKPFIWTKTADTIHPRCCKNREPNVREGTLI